LAWAGELVELARNAGLVIGNDAGYCHRIRDCCEHTIIFSLSP